MSPKSLFKIARDKLFKRVYFCLECAKKDQKLLFMHYEEFHACHSEKNIIKKFICRTHCREVIEESEILYHFNK